MILLRKSKKAWCSELTVDGNQPPQFAQHSWHEQLPGDLTQNPLQHQVWTSLQARWTPSSEEYTRNNENKGQKLWQNKLTIHFEV